MVALLRKPWRGYPSANCVMAVRLHVNMNNPESQRGQVGLTPGKAKHVGTIPQGAFVLPAIRHTLVAFNGTTPALTVGSEADPDGFIVAADAGAGAVGVQDGLVGALTGYLADETAVFITLTGTGTITAGRWDFVLPFYIQRS